MQLGLVGYYGFGNYGDELFREVFEASFPGDRVEVLHDSPRAPWFSEGVAQAVARVDRVIIGGGDLVIPWARSELYWRREYLEKPVHIAGVGVPTWGGSKVEILEELRSFFQHPNVRSILCRDERSRHWVEQHLRPSCPLDVAPDLVCAHGLYGHAARARAEGHCPRVRGERRLVLVTRAQPNLEHRHIEALCRRALAQGYRIRQLVLATGPTAADDEAAVASWDFPYREVVRADSLEALTEELASADLVVSMKFHGCVAAFLAGVPTIALSGADKFLEFFRDTKKELFLSTSLDEKLSERMIDPMYEIAPRELVRLEAEARAGLARLRDEVHA